MRTLAAALAGSLLASPSALAQDAAAEDCAAPAGEPRHDGGCEPIAAAPSVRSASERRAVPDYDGVPGRGPQIEEVLIWFPRLALAPLYLVSEMLVRRPIAALIEAVERENLHRALIEVFTWDEYRAGWIPTAFYDFGLLPSVGFFFFWNDLGARGHRLRAHAAFGGVDRLHATLSERIALSETVTLSFRAEGSRRPDRVYAGTGPVAREERARYRHALVEGGAELAITPWRRSRWSVGVAISHHSFDPNGYDPGGADPPLAERLDNTELQPPAGFEGYTAYRQYVTAALDTREEPPAPGHGVRIDGFAQQAFDMRAAARSWIRYGAAIAGFADAGAERVFSLHLWAELADPLGALPVPLLERAVLGGSVLELAGFLRGALVGRSAVVATVRYRYPIWVLLDACFFASLGNVFGEHFEDFEVGLLRVSWGFAIESAGDSDHAFRLAVAFGTEPIAHGASVSSVRFLVGGVPSF